MKTFVALVFMLLVSLVVIPRPVAAADDTNSTITPDKAATWAAKYAEYGTLIVKPFDSAPFPHPARADGHKYHDKVYTAAENYSDNTVAIFIPKTFHETGAVDLVVHFHGWNNTVAGTLVRYKLIEQFSESGVNAILVVPEGPHNASDSFGGKLEDTNGFARFIEETVAKLKSSGALKRGDFTVNKIIISGHSGGYHVMSALLDHGGLSDNIKETWLFDALYGGTENFVAWQKRTGGRLLDIYTDHGGTKEETETLMANYKKQNIPFAAGEDGAVTESALRDNKLVFIHTDLPHDKVVQEREEFRKFLKTSCLTHE